jgi:predicted thioesterase
LERDQVARDPDVGADVGIRRVISYRVRRRDLASRIYLFLAVYDWLLRRESSRKPPVIASARLLRLCELAAMSAIPGGSLGVNFAMNHVAGVGRGSRLVVVAECTKRRGRYWEWYAEVGNSQGEVIAWCTLGFIADINAKCYTAQRLAPQFAARTIGERVWIRVCDTLGGLSVMTIPVQVVYVWHGWISMLATEAILAAGWLLGLTGLPFAISDWLTIRKESTKGGVR